MKNLFKRGGTVTGRFSGTQPNVSNVPQQAIRTDPKALQIVHYLEEKLSCKQYRRSGPFEEDIPVDERNIVPWIGCKQFSFFMWDVPTEFFNRVIVPELLRFAEQFGMSIKSSRVRDTSGVYVVFDEKTEEDF